MTTYGIHSRCMLCFMLRHYVKILMLHKNKLDLGLGIASIAIIQSMNGYNLLKKLAISIASKVIIYKILATS